MRVAWRILRYSSSRMPGSPLPVIPDARKGNSPGSNLEFDVGDPAALPSREAGIFPFPVEVRPRAPKDRCLYSLACIDADDPVGVAGAAAGGTRPVRAWLAPLESPRRGARPV